MYGSAVNRLYRKAKSMLRPREAAALSLAAAMAVASGYGAWAFYREAAPRTPLIAAINSIGVAEAGEGVRQASLLPAAGSRGAATGVGASGVSGTALAPAHVAAAVAPSHGIAEMLQNPQVNRNATTNTDNNSTTTTITPTAGAIPTTDSSAPQEHGAAPQENGTEAESTLAPSQQEHAAASQEHGAAPQENGAAPDSTLAPPPPLPPQEELFTVKVDVDGVRYVFVTPSMTVEAFLAGRGISVSEHDRLSGAYLDGVIDSDLYIVISRVAYRVEEVNEPIPRDTKYRGSTSLEIGSTRVVAEGKDGMKLSKYLVTVVDGDVESRKLVKSVVHDEPTDKIVEQGRGGATVNVGGKSVKYEKKIENVRCTAYTSSYEDTGKRPGDPGFGITKTGMAAREGVVAVDPEVIPLHAKLYIEILEDGVPDYGFAVAGDTGSKIKGKKVDLYFDWERSELLEFGVKAANVYILEGD